jgi:hypothetical protein
MKMYTWFLPLCYPNLSQSTMQLIKLNFEKYNLYHMLNFHRDLDNFFLQGVLII